MPIYLYSSDDGETVERLCPMGKAPKSIYKLGRRYVRDIPAEWGGRRDNSGCWPKKSDALGVLHSQIEEAAEHLTSQGVPTNFTNDGTGRCIVESRGHQNKIMEALKMHDRDAGYGDRAKP